MRTLLLLGAILLAGCGTVSGPDTRYRRIDPIRETLDRWAEEQPELLRVESIGASRLGEPILAARIGREGAPKPVVLLVAALHANEANGTGALMVLLERLLSKYGREPETTALVDGLTVWCVPVANPDGHREVFSGGPGWAECRKNAGGVDLNRNWDHHWENDPSTDPGSRNYKGPRPMSEPEVRALADLVLRERPVVVVDLHSPGRITPPNRVFWPWLEKGSGKLGPDARAYRDVARYLAAHTETEVDGVFMDGDGYGFDTLPKMQNWIYARTGACALLMEITTGFWWEGPTVDAVAERVATGLRALLERTRNGPGLVVRADPASEILVAEHHDPRIGPRRPHPAHGTHWRLLSPGPATVTVRRSSGGTISEEVRIPETGWLELDHRR